MTPLFGPKVFRWLVVGVLFELPDLLLIKVTVGVLGWPYAVGTFCSGWLCTVGRFLVLDRCVFGHARPSFTRLGQYHVANAFGFAIWWSSANALEFLGLHYLVASLVATAVSAGFNLAASFRWVWRKPSKTPGSSG